eukprot:6394092-Prymnesium_polylepis.1
MSHVGAPANEWADVLAGEAMASEQRGRGRRLCVCRGCQYASARRDRRTQIGHCSPGPAASPTMLQCQWGSCARR